MSIDSTNTSVNTVWVLNFFRSLNYIAIAKTLEEQQLNI